MPAATVVIPTKNRYKLLATTLRSVLAQRGVDLKVVIVDDSSTDEARARIADLATGEVEVVHLPEPMGVSVARNAAITRVGTEWVAFCDDDDLWAPDKLARQLGALEQRPATGWCITGSVGFDESLHIVGHARALAGETLYPRLLEANVVPGGGSGVVARTELVREVGGFRPDLTFGEDWEMWIRLARAAPAVAVDRPLVAYRIWPGAVSSIVAIEESLRTIDEVHADERHRLGIRASRTGIELRRATDDALQGNRLGSARRFARLTAMQRNPKKLVVAAMAALAPRRTYRRLVRRSASDVPQGWITDVRQWLPELLDGAPSTARHG